MHKQYITEAKFEAILQEREKYTVRSMVDENGRPDVFTRVGCVLLPRDFIFDAWKKPVENIIVDDCDLCSEINPADECKPTSEKITGTCFYAGYIRRIWGHFIMNSTARLWYPLMLMDAGKFPDDAKIVFVVASDEDTGFWKEGNYAEFFRLLGIADRVVVINSPTEFESLTVPALGFNLQFHVSPEWCDIFKKVRSAALQETTAEDTFPKRIYFSKSAWHSHIRKEIGADLVDNYFEKNGFAVVYPEHIPLPQMIRLLDNAKVLAFTSGSVAHNVLFAREKTQTIIIEKMPTTTIFQEPANLASGIEPVYVEGALFMRPVEQAMGPFMYYYTDFWREFTNDIGGRHPDGKYLSDGNVRKRLRTFFRSYRRIYKKAIEFDMYMLDESHLYFMALERANEVLRPWLYGEKALFISDYFDPFFWARRIKRFLGK